VCVSLLTTLREEHGEGWYHQEGSRYDCLVGWDWLTKAAQSTWWEWTGGSTPFFLQMTKTCTILD